MTYKLIISVFLTTLLLVDTTDTGFSLVSSVLLALARRQYSILLALVRRQLAFFWHWPGVSIAYFWNQPDVSIAFFWHEHSVFTLGGVGYKFGLSLG